MKIVIFCLEVMALIPSDTISLESRVKSSEEFKSIYSSDGESLQPEVPSTRKRARGKPEFSVEELLQKKCCDQKCFKKLTQLAIESCRDRFASYSSETQQNQFVIDYMKDHARKDKSVLYCISGEQVCETCWRFTYGLRYGKFKALKDKFASGVVIIEHGLTGRLNTSESTLRMVGWMRSFFGKVGDKMPMSDTINLPSCLTKHDVYELAKDDLTQGGLQCCSSSYMYEIWRTEFPNVKIPKENRFSMCDVCASIKEARERTLNPSVRRWLSEVMEKHVKLQKNEREKYAKHRSKAEKYPSKYISIIVDGMDQNKTNIPHIISNPKAIAGSYLLETHVTGLRAHGRITIMAIDCNNFRHDSNLTIEVILKLLTLLKGSLSKVLYIQLDNTCRDNKNKYTLMFFFLLVEFGIFEKIKIGFLPVGHTHEDIDQLFSCISRRLKHSNALTIPGLQEVIQGSFSPLPEVYEISKILDVKSWMMPCIPPIHDHLKAHQFKFEKSKGITRMYYKEWSSDKFWLPQSGINMLTGSNCLDLESKPLVISPLFDPEVLNKLEATINKASAYLERSEANAWWRSWLTKARGHTTLEQHPLNGDWVVKALASTTSVVTASRQETRESQTLSVCSLSGVEMESPHVKVIGSKEVSHEIPGIGFIATSWIGHAGREQLFAKFSKEIVTPKIQDLKKELSMLASVCLKAFQSFEAIGNTLTPDAQKAVDLCEQYAMKPKQQRIEALFTPMSDLWKNASSSSQEPEDKVELATTVLGEKIVGTITEEHKDPPHIYIGSRRGKQDILENRDIVKELKLGMLVAVQSKHEIPHIGEVRWIQPNPILESKVIILLYEQEKAPHKPKWLRFFTKTAREKEISISDIILYDFTLTNKGAIRKSTREFFNS